MTQSLTLSVKGVNGIRTRVLFKFFVSQNWGFVSNLTIKGDIAYVNIVNWENKFPHESDELSLQYKDKVLKVHKLNWTPRKKWDNLQFSVLTSFIECGR